MKCVLQNCEQEGIWRFENGMVESLLCDKCYRNLVAQVMESAIDAEAGNLFGRSLIKARESRNETFVLEILPTPKSVSPNAQLAAAQSILAIANLNRKHHLTKVQTAVASQMICRTMMFVGEQAHKEATEQN